MSAAWLPRAAEGGPLAGVRVLDFSELLPGPFLTQSMVELGADVLKAERPPHGDAARRMAPALFEAMNRGKRCFQADLKSDAQRAGVLALADEADVLVEAYRPGVLDRLGLGYDTLVARNPRLVYVSLTGYGASGPRAQWPGHDINYLAASGSLALTSGSGAPAFAVPVADLGGAVYALAAVNAALFQRERSGRGQRLDVSLTDCMLHWMNTRLVAFRHNGATDLAAQSRTVSARPGYGVFTCAGGEPLSVAALEDHFWKSLVQVLALDAWQGDAFAIYAKRMPHAEAINCDIGAALSGMSRAQAVALLAGADVPVHEVLSPNELPDAEQFGARDLYTATGSGALCRFPVRMEGVGEPPTHAQTA
ncbi:CaiB/BaiF CoA-transferase family protein [Piscinibacter gummiphilus]|uniref:CaiB/BaiF CoA-transferase family protein n=1 Tax=Piscinibacter gummiphilus TaxID=946333 RepID=A0ABZ0CME7_9BURK|nr:CaiB/BaiF CoA-transferase family protein [Piscinibacter gummiphilus]WOB06153.1 CaiB/BaiF CoA-transferase family protein [Piscinibacter gummiphilus]